MENEMMWIYLALLLAMLAGFMMGKMHERIEWNNLIKKGKLPRPDQVQTKANKEALEFMRDKFNSQDQMKGERELILKLK